jgi:A/G-specific adenine glycosylase
MDRDLQSFQKTVLDYYHQNGRHDLPWRQPAEDGLFSPYAIAVSELMLQQTQVGRVIPKYQTFLAAFPDMSLLAAAPLSEVLKLWSGLGYNRRAKFLWTMAQQVVDEYGGVFPGDRAGLTSLPGIGPNTAGAIMAYAYNSPEAFIETNIRTVFIHHFFKDYTKVPDSRLLSLVAAAVPKQGARMWYWALMDYGTHLKRTVGNVSRTSATYAKQSAFQGSRRQVRGRVLKLLAEGAHPLKELQSAISDERLLSVLEDLTTEGFIVHTDNVYQLRML